METAKKRGIVIYDLDINGDTEEIFEIHSLLKEYAEGFKSFVKDRNPKLAKNVTLNKLNLVFLWLNAVVYLVKSRILSSEGAG